MTEIPRISVKRANEIKGFTDKPTPRFAVFFGAVVSGVARHKLNQFP